MDGIAKSPAPVSEWSLFVGPKTENNEARSVSVENFIIFSSSVAGETALDMDVVVVSKFSSSELGDFLAMGTKVSCCCDDGIFCGVG